MELGESSIGMEKKLVVIILRGKVISRD